MADRFGNMLTRYGAVNRLILNTDGGTEISYTGIRAVSASEKGVKKLERARKKVVRNMQIVEGLAQTWANDDTDKKVLRAFYRQYINTLSEIDDAKDTILRYMEVRQATVDWENSDGGERHDKRE